MIGEKEGAVDQRIGKVDPFWPSQITIPALGGEGGGAIGAYHLIGRHIQGAPRRPFV